MREECVRVVRQAAARLGRKAPVEVLRDIESKIVDARKQMARENPEAYRALSPEQQIAQAGDRVISDAIRNSRARYRKTKLSVLKDYEARTTMDRMVESGLTHLQSLRHYVAMVADGKGKVQSMESRAEGIASMYVGKLRALDQLVKESSIGGIQITTKHMNDYINESFGVDSGNPTAKRAFKEVEAARSALLKRYRNSGGDMAELANYRNPQALYAYKVARKGGYKGKKYVEDYMQWVDRNEYVNPDGTLMNDTQMREFLRESFITVKSAGANKPIGMGNTAKAVNRMKAHRQLHYKSPEAYMAAMDKYGSGGVFEQTINHIHSMANDIAMLEHLGPNPINQFEKLYAEAVQKDGGATDPLLYDAFKSMSGQRETKNVAVAHWAGELRSMIVANRLGSMLFAQLADAGTAKAVTNSLNMTSAELAKWYGRVVGDQELRNETLRLHALGVETALNEISRFANDVSAAGFFGKAATVIPTIQGAHLWTRTLRQAVGAMLEAKVGNMSRKYKNFKDMPEVDRATFESLGVTEQDWSVWTMADAMDYKGDRLLGPDSIEAIPLDKIKKAFNLDTDRQAEMLRQDAAMSLVTMTVEQSHQAVLQPSALSMATLKGSAARGDVISEIAQMVLQFKSFPISFQRQALFERARFNAGTNPMVFRAKLIGVTTILGGMALLLNDMASGKDPRQIYDEDDPMKSVDFGVKAMLKGGGLGFFGDIMESITKAAEDPFRSTNLSGPVAGEFLGAVAPSVYHGVKALATGDEKEKEKFTKYAYKSMIGATPGQNLWFLKGFLHNVILNDLQEMANPGYNERTKKRIREDYGQEYWMGRGEELRAPDLGNIIGE